MRFFGKPDIFCPLAASSTGFTNRKLLEADLYYRAENKLFSQVFFLGVLARGGWQGESDISVHRSRIVRRHYRSLWNASATSPLLAQEANDDLRPRQNSQGEPDCQLRILGTSAYCEEHPSYPTYVT